MPDTHLHIINMCCGRCIETVQQLLSGIQQKVGAVTHGEADRVAINKFSTRFKKMIAKTAANVK